MAKADCPFFIGLLGDFGLCNFRPRRCGGRLERHDSGSMFEQYLCGRTGMIIQTHQQYDTMSGRTETAYQIVGYKGGK